MKSGVLRSLRCAQLLALALVGILGGAGCARTPAPGPAHVEVPRLRDAVVIDGHLTEPCYGGMPLVEKFVIASAPGKTPASTRAWLFWEPDRFVFAFDVSDANIVAAPPSERETDVDPQDRVELFLWSGRTQDPYYCIEIGARGAIHDYSARFYRRFDDTWSPTGWSFAVMPSPDGYRVEGELSRAAVEQMGFRLAPGERLEVGLFRADFHPGRMEPDWLCWVDARGPQPDFHVAASFGEIRLQP